MGYNYVMGCNALLKKQRAMYSTYLLWCITHCNGMFKCESHHRVDSPRFISFTNHIVVCTVHLFSIHILFSPLNNTCGENAKVALAAKGLRGL